MTEQMVVDESKLQEMIAREVTKILRSGYQDIDEIRKSPAGAIIRVEAKLENLQEKVELIEEKVDQLGVQVEAYRAETKQENVALRAELAKNNETLRAELAKNVDTLRTDNQNIRNEVATMRNEMATKSHINLIYGLLIALIGFVGTITVKLFFFAP